MNIEELYEQDEADRLRELEEQRNRLARFRILRLMTRNIDLLVDIGQNEVYKIKLQRGKI